MLYTEMRDIARKFASRSTLPSERWAYSNIHQTVVPQADNFLVFPGTRYHAHSDEGLIRLFKDEDPKPARVCREEVIARYQAIDTRQDNIVDLGEYFLKSNLFQDGVGYLVIRNKSVYVVTSFEGTAFSMYLPGSYAREAGEVVPYNLAPLVGLQDELAPYAAWNREMVRFGSLLFGPMLVMPRPKIEPIQAVRELQFA